MKLPTPRILNQVVFGGFACAALALSTGCQTVKKVTPKVALKPKVERKILDPRDNVPPPYVKPKSIVKVRPDGSAHPQAHQAGTVRSENSVVTQAPSASPEPVAIERHIPGHSIGIAQVEQVSVAAAAQPAPAPLEAAPALASAPVLVPQQPNSLIPAAVAPVAVAPQPTALELDTSIAAIDISPAPLGRELGGLPAATAVAIAPAPVAEEIVLQELPQEPVIEEVAVTAIADVQTIQPVIEEPATTLLPAAAALAAPADLGAAPAEVEPLPTYAFKPMSYTVVKGDSLWKIGHIHGVTVAEIASFNNINASRPLKIGQQLELPPGAKFIPAGERASVKPVKRTNKPVAAVAAVTSKPKGKKPRPSGNVHVVKSGDNLWDISRKYGVKVSELRKLNSLKSDVLQINQTLKLGQVASAPPAKAKPVETTGTLAAAAIDIDLPSKPETTNTPADEGTPAAVAVIVDEPEVNEQPEDKPATLDISKLKTLPHVVGENDTLEIISGMYNSTPEWIKHANDGLQNNADLTSVFKGKEITVPCRGIGN